MIFGIKTWWGWKKYKVTHIEFATSITTGTDEKTKKVIELPEPVLYLYTDKKMIAISKINTRDWFISKEN